MDTPAPITLLLSLYAAALSTYLGIRELRRDARILTVFLTYIAFYERYAITITVSTISIDIPSAGQVKEALILQENEGLSFPFTLNDGEIIHIALPLGVCEDICDAKEKIYVSVFDSEGRVYSKYKRMMYNAKFGGLTPR